MSLGRGGGRPNTNTNTNVSESHDLPVGRAWLGSVGICILCCLAFGPLEEAGEAVCEAGWWYAQLAACYLCPLQAGEISELKEHVAVMTSEKTQLQAELEQVRQELTAEQQRARDAAKTHQDEVSDPSLFWVRSGCIQSWVLARCCEGSCICAIHQQ